MTTASAPRTARSVGTFRRGEAGRVARFSAVGAANTAITLALFVVLTALGTPSPLASGVAFLAGAANSYALNRRWTFAGLRAAPRARTRFVAIQCSGAALSAAGVAALGAAGAAHLTAELAITPAVTVALYGAARRLVFRTDVG